MSEARVGRLAHLDVLRGFALLGILFVNLTWFTGWAVLGVAEPAAFEPTKGDLRASALIHFIVEAKFYTLFSILFGRYWGELGATRLCLVAVGIFAFSTLVSWLWLKRFRQGPLEWIWRRLAYGRTR